MSSQVINVACAVIRKQDLYLVVQRSASMREPLLWEFAGGKIETNETLIQCVHRELSEELGLKIAVRGVLRASVVDRGSSRIILYPVLCVPISLHIELREHKEARWLGLSDLVKLDFCAADLDILKVLHDRQLEASRWWLP